MPTTATRHRAATRPRTRTPRRVETNGPVRLRVDGLSATAPDGTVLLDDVSFSLRQGWLVAVVGPTGAGKSSLANALTGALRTQSGKVWLDGLDLATADDAVRRRIAYVPQDSVLHPQLDLRRTLDYAAILRLPASVSAQERGRRVDAVLAELGLEGSARLAVGTLSGGQRKRANVAAELVGDPQVVVLDEPTSGLDPGYEKSVLSTLRQLADGGRTVLTVTHSVAALAVCDRVLFLAPGGRVAFFGPPAAAAAFFDSADAADVFTALDAEPGSTWQQRFRSHPAYAEYVTSTTSGDAVASSVIAPTQRWRTQLTTLVRRHTALIRSDRRHLLMLLLEGPLLGLLLFAVIAPHALGPWGSDSPTTASVAMFLAVSATWLGATNAIREIVKERLILRREVGSGLSPGAYVAAKLVVLGLVTSAQVSVLTTVALLRQGPIPRGAVLGSGLAELVLAAVVASFAAVTLALLVSALVTTPDKALTILPVTMVAQLALTGGPASLFTVPGIRQLRALTGSYWSVEAITATVAGDSGAWWRATAALVALASLCIAATYLCVRRSTRPASRTDVWQRDITLPSGWLLPLAGAAALLLGAGTVAVVADPFGGGGRTHIPAAAAYAVGTPAQLAKAEAVASVQAPPVVAAPPVAVPVVEAETRPQVSGRTRVAVAPVVAAVPEVPLPSPLPAPDFVPVVEEAPAEPTTPAPTLTPPWTGPHTASPEEASGSDVPWWAGYGGRG